MLILSGARGRGTHRALGTLEIPPLERGARRTVRASLRSAGLAPGRYRLAICVGPKLGGGAGPVCVAARQATVIASPPVPPAPTATPQPTPAATPAAAPRLEVHPRSLTFGTHPPGTLTPVQRLTVTTPPESAVASGIGVAPAAPFTLIATTCTGALLGGETCTIDLALRTRTWQSVSLLRSYDESLAITTTTPGAAGAQVRLQGGERPWVVQAALEHADLSFLLGDTQSGGSTTQTFRNTGTDPVVVTSISPSELTGVSYATDGCVGATIEPGASCDVVMTIRAANPGETADEMQLVDYRYSAPDGAYASSVTGVVVSTLAG